MSKLQDKASRLTSTRERVPGVWTFSRSRFFLRKLREDLRLWPKGAGRERVPEGRCDRSLARSAWDRCHPKEPSRRVRFDSCRCAHRFDDWSEEVSNRKLKQKHGAQVDDKYLWDSLHPIIPYPTGRFFRPIRALSLAHGRGRFARHFVPGYDRCCPYGTPR
jgi:hypothetical protein